MKNFKRMVAIFFSLAMILAFIPSMVWAAGEGSHTVKFYKEAGDEPSLLDETTVNDNETVAAPTAETLNSWGLGSSTAWSTTNYTVFKSTQSADAYNFNDPVTGDLNLYAYGSLIGTGQDVQGPTPGPGTDPVIPGWGDSTKVAKIGNIEYESLNEAFTAATAGNTIKLLADVTYGTDKAVDLWTKAVNLDLNGHTLTTNSEVSVELNNMGYKASAICYTIPTENAGNVKVSNGTIVTAHGAGVYADDPGLTMTLEDLTINANTVSPQQTNEYSSAIRITGGAKVIINNGSYSGYNALTVSNSGGEFVINGGTFTGKVFFSEGTDSGKTKKITIKDGKFDGEFVNADKGMLTISGGIFKNAPANNYLAEGYVVTNNTDASTSGLYPYKVVSTAVAQIGETKYATLSDAVAAVKSSASSSRKTITLLADTDEVPIIDFTYPVQISGNGHKIGLGGAIYAMQIAENNADVIVDDVVVGSWSVGRGIEVAAGNVTLLVQNSHVYGEHYPINVYDRLDKGVKNNNITITNSTVEGYCALNLWGEGGTVNVTGGTLYGKNIYNYTPSEDNYFGVICLEGPGKTGGASNYTVNISGAAIKAETTKADSQGHKNKEYIVLFNPNSTDNTVKLANCTIDRGGDNILYPMLSEESGSSGNKAYVKATTDISTSDIPVLPDGYVYRDAGTDGYRLIEKPVYVAQIGDDKYESLAAAVEAASDGDTIELLADIDLPVTENVHIKNKNITIDGQDLYTVSGGDTPQTSSSTYPYLNYGPIIVEDSNVTLQNLTISKENGNAAFLSANNDGYGVVFKNVTITGKSATGLYIAGGSAEIEDTSVHQSGTHPSTWRNNALAVSGGATVNVRSGSFYSDTEVMSIYTSGGTINVYGGTFDGIIKTYGTSGYPGAKNTINIKGGYFNNYTPSIVSGDTLTISGGYFDAAPDEKYLADGYSVKTGSWTYKGKTYGYKVESDYVAQIGETKYETLAAALDAVRTAVSSTSTTIELLKDTEEENVTIDFTYPVVIEGNGFGIAQKSYSKEQDTAALAISAAGANVTLDNVVVGSDKIKRGVNVLANTANLTLTIQNGTEIYGGHYPLNVLPGADNAKINVTDSTISGYCALNHWGNDCILNFTDSTLAGLNTYAQSSSNDFGVICIEADIADFGGTMDKKVVSGNTITVNGCTIGTTSTYGNNEYVVLFNGYGCDKNGATIPVTSEYNPVNNTVIFTGTNYVDYGGDDHGAFVYNCTDANCNNKVLVYGGVYAKGDVNDYCAEGYEAVAHQTTHGGVTYAYQVGKVEAKDLAPATTTHGYDATYTATKTVVDTETGEVIKRESNMTINLVANDNSVSTNNDLANYDVEKIIEEAMDKASGEQTTLNVVIDVVSDNGTSSGEGASSKITYKVHPVATVKTTGDVTVGTFDVSNDQLSGASFTIKLKVPQALQSTGKVKITHKLNDGSTVVYPELAYEGTGDNCYVNVADVTEFSEFELEIATASGGDASYGFTLSLKNKIAIPFYVYNLTSDASNYKVDYSYINTEGTRVEQTVKLGPDCSVGGGWYRIVVAEFSAKQMNDKVHVKLYTNSKTIYERDYSIKDYCESTINDPDGNLALKNLCKATLDYGRAAQRNFGYGEPVTDSYYFNPENTTIDSKYAGSINTTILDYAGATLSLKSQTQLNFYLKEKQGESYTYTVDGKSVTPGTAGNYKMVSISKIAAKNLDSEVSVTVTKGGKTSETYSYSPLNYAYAVQQNSTNTHLIEVCKTMYNYWGYANNYFSN